MAKELDEANHIWIKSLTDTMDRRQAENLINRSRELIDRPEAGYVDAVLQIVSKANRELFDEVKKEDENMYRAFVELMQPEIDEAVSVAVSEAVSETEFVTTARNKVEAIENAMKKLGMSKEDACGLMDTTPEEYDAYKEVVKNAAIEMIKDRILASRKK